MDKIQKKVLLFLLNELKEQVREMSCDEAKIPGLEEDERRLLTQMLYSYWSDLDEWDGTANAEFSISSLASLAQYWLTGKKN